MSQTTIQGTVPEGATISPQFLPVAFFQNRFLAFENAQLSIATHALHYGTAVLGGIRGYPAANHPQRVLLFRIDAHCKRLANSAKYLGYAIKTKTLETQIIEFVKRNQPKSPFYIRPLIYTSSLGIAPRLHDIEKDLIIYGVTLGEYLIKTGVRCRFSSWTRQEDRSQPLRGKSSAAYIASALAKTEAVESGFDEAILLNSHGKVSEASAMNLFLVRNGQLITPSVDQDILEGITRDSILFLAKDLGIPVVERPVDKSELLIADEVFLCGTAAQICPVERIETHALPHHHPITTHLSELLQAIMVGRNEHHWVTSVEV